MADEMYSTYVDQSCTLHVNNEDDSVFQHIIEQVRNYNTNMYLSSIILLIFNVQTI